MRANRQTITQCFDEFRRGGGVTSLLRFFCMVIRQGRVLELLHGLYSFIRFRPSPLVEREVSFVADDIRRVAQDLIDSHRRNRIGIHVLFREDLVARYGDRYAIDRIPEDFKMCRRQSIVEQDGYLILGEYGDASGRLAVVTQEDCTIEDYYNRIKGLRHIHLIHPTGVRGLFYVTTGDSVKRLDIWELTDDGTLQFRGCQEKRLAGYTDCVRLNGCVFFGSDFSSRPNFLKELNAARHFLPARAFKTYVASLDVVQDRYILICSKNVTRHDLGGWFLTIFDTERREFIACHSIPEVIGAFQINAPAISPELPADSTAEAISA
ncbi:hypothetical protein KQI84_00615 [bacterium]|nr:hypothetical protein [bacterium]